MRRGLTSPDAGDGAPPARPRELAVPDARRALARPGPADRAPVSERAGRRVLRAAAAAVLFAGAAALAVPLTRTVALTGRLEPEHVVRVRAGEPGLITQIYVAPGDTVRPGQPLARLRSPELDVADHASTGHDAALLARRARLDVHAPPWAERRPDGAADPTTWWGGGVVLTEGLDERRGARVDAGDVVVELASVGADGRVSYVVRGCAPERAAQRARPGMRARVTFTAFPIERPRQVTGTVQRVGAAPDVASLCEPPSAGWERRWRVEVGIDPRDVARVVAHGNEMAVLRAGFSADIAVEERRETLMATVRRWVVARFDAAVRPPPAGVGR